jgi:pyruvate,orthophosphate dikinase
LTSRGGRTSHAAVVARQLNKVCIVGCRDLGFPDNGRSCLIAGRPFAPNDVMSLDGHTGAVYAGKLEVRVERPTAYLREVKRWLARKESRDG